MFSELEKSGYHIPVAAVASAAFIKKPPEWVLSDHCFMCRQEFNRFKGKLRVSACVRVCVCVCVCVLWVRDE